MKITCEKKKKHIKHTGKQACRNVERFVPLYFRSRERKVHRWNFRSFRGTFASWNFRSSGANVPRTFAPWNFRYVRTSRLCQELLFQASKNSKAVAIHLAADDILLPADPRTRHHHSFKFKHIQSHTTQYKHSFFVRTVPEWNSLPEACVNVDTITAFQTQLHYVP